MRYLRSSLLAFVLAHLFALPAFATTTTVYPNAHTETVSVDGRTYHNAGNASWATVRGDTSAPYANDDGTTGSISAEFGGGLYYLGRAYFLFDTSAIPDSDVISAVTLQLHGNGAPNNANTTDIDIVDSTPASNTAIATGDYDQVGSTVFASIALGSWNASAMNTFTLDAAGIAAINKTGITKLGARIARDTDNSAPTGINLVSVYFADHTGTDHDPVLTITHAAPAPTCGDSAVESPEECDDGNTDAADGCSDVCEVEDGWTCDASEPSICEEDAAPGGSSTDMTDAAAYSMWVGSFLIFAAVAFWPSRR